MARASEVPTPEQPRRSLFNPLRAALGKAVGRLVSFPAQLASAREQGILEERQRQEGTMEARIKALEAAHQQELVRVRAADRLDGAQLVARTVAHELNNGLGPIIGYTELLARDPGVSQNEKLANYTLVIREAADETMEKISQFAHIVRLAEAPPEMGLGKGKPILDLAKSIQAEPPIEKS